MQFQFVPMTEAYARQMIATWKYPDEYALYDYDKAARHLLKKENWGRWLFAVLDENRHLVGEITLGFLDTKTFEWVPDAAVEAGHLRDSTLWIGFGLRPDLTGQGLGQKFVEACVNFALHTARARYGYTGDEIGLRVYKFNLRAIKVYERVGFVKFWEGWRLLEDRMLEVQRMKMKIQDFLDRRKA